MKERDQPAAPGRVQGSTLVGPGLTKFEATAIAAMQGLLANGEQMRSFAYNSQQEGFPLSSYVTSFAVQHANALWDEIEREKGE